MKHEYVKKCIRIIDSTEEEKQLYSEQTGELIRLMTEGYAIWDIAEKLCMSKEEIEERLNMILYLCRRQVGKWNYILETFKH